MSTTSLGIAASGVREVGGVFKKGGGNPGGKPAGGGLKVAGGGLKVAGGGFGVGVEGSMPAARNLSSNDRGSTEAPFDGGG